MNDLRIINVNAVTIDGAIGSHSLESDEERLAYGGTSKEDQGHLRCLLESSDAVITGANSLRAARKAWEVRNPKTGKFVEWYVYTNSGLSSSLDFWNQINVPRTLVSKRPLLNLPDAMGVKNICYESSEPAKFLFGFLLKLNFKRVLLFGGGSINRMFFQENLVDEVIISLCPVILGSPNRSHYCESGLSHPISLELTSSIQEGNLVLLKYNVKK